MKQIYSLLVLLFIAIQVHAQLNGKSFSVQLSATVQESPAQITLHWPNDVNDSAYRIGRRLSINDPWTVLSTLPGSTNSYTDTKVSVGTPYEYIVIRYVPKKNNYFGIGYINSGIKVPLVESRGTLILLIDNDFTTVLKSQIDRLIYDMAGDGWSVITHTVKKSDAVTDVKATIVNDYNNDPTNVKAVFLLGHIPVPYSGGSVLTSSGIDGHPNHAGAWPADAYYGDMTGTWTDNSVNLTTSDYAAQKNTPGDGKFDQDFLPANVDLQIGRVDMYDMPAFSPYTETDLMKRYLDKDHMFKVKYFTAREKGLVQDNFGPIGVQGTYPEEFSASGYKNFSTMFGDNNVVAGSYRTDMQSNSYLWSYGTGGGDFVSAGGITSTSNFVTDSLQTVFTMLFGSYFGDWNVTNNFLRAPLASKGMTLTDCWSGRPEWVYHHMALGANIGYSAWISQNDYTDYFRTVLLPASNDYRLVTPALMGDPTLRLHVVAPPAKIWLASTKTGATVKWNKSEDALFGYAVYRSTGLNKSWTRLNASLISDTTYTDNSGGKGLYYYMVKAVKLQQSASGTYFNSSIGTIDTVTLVSTGIASNNKEIKSLTVYPNPTSGRFIISWSGESASMLNVQIMNITGKIVSAAVATGVDKGGIIPVDAANLPAGLYLVRVTSGTDVFEQKILKN